MPQYTFSTVHLSILTVIFSIMRTISEMEKKVEKGNEDVQKYDQW